MDDLSQGPFSQPVLVQLVRGIPGPKGVALITKQSRPRPEAECLFGGLIQSECQAQFHRASSHLTILALRVDHLSKVVFRCDGKDKNVGARLVLNGQIALCYQARHVPY